MMAAAIPAIFRPEELALHLGVSERTLRAVARAHGACSIIGKTMIMTETDVIRLMEATKPCHTKSTSAAKSGTTGAPQPAGDFEALQALRTNQQPKGSQRKRKTGNGNVTWMDRGRK